MTEREKKEAMIRTTSERIFERMKYWPCLVEHREEAIRAVFDRDLCALMKIFDACEVPCKHRWDLVEIIIEKAKEPNGPQFW